MPATTSQRDSSTPRPQATYAAVPLKGRAAGLHGHAASLLRRDFAADDCYLRLAHISTHFAQASHIYISTTAAAGRV